MILGHRARAGGGGTEIGEYLVGKVLCKEVPERNAGLTGRPLRRRQKEAQEPGGEAGWNWPSRGGDREQVQTCEGRKHLAFSSDSASPRYQNFSKGRWSRGTCGLWWEPTSWSSGLIVHPPTGSRHGSDPAYIDPIPMDYYNWGQFRKPKEDDDDANSYENVLICKQQPPESGDEGSEDYQNSASIQQWRESKRVVGRVQREAPSSPAGSPEEDDDGEPDYVNGDVPATEA